MSIKLEIKYTDKEYLVAQRERIEAMPNNGLYTLLSVLFFVGLVFLLTHYKVALTWWGISLTLFTGGYALLSLFLVQLGPYINLALAKKTKLDNTYLFVIDQNIIRRSTEVGTLEVSWKQLDSVEFSNENVTLHLKNKNGSMLIPNARLREHELETLKAYADVT